MQLRFNVGLLALVALLGLTNEALAARQEFTKTINKEFPITADGFTELQNKYGNVTVRTWNQNKVKIDIVIKVQARDQSAAQTAFDRINVVFSNSASSVRAVTEIEASRGGWWNWGDSSNDFKIYYDVYIPEQGSLTVGVKYGNVATAAIGGILNLDVKYGNIKADGADGQTTIALSYGNGSLTRARNITINVAYGDFTIGEAQEITARGRYGHYKIERAANIRADSRYHGFEVQQANKFQCDCGYDNLKFGQLGELIISGSYTDAEVRQLSRGMTLNLSYGDVEIDRLESGFSEIDVTVNYTDIKIGVDPAAQYSVDITGHYTDVNVPSSLSLSYDYEKSSSRQVKGQTGGGGGGVIRGKLSYGDFNLYKH